jgi:integrase
MSHGEVVAFRPRFSDRNFTYLGDGVLAKRRKTDGKIVYYIRYRYQGRPIVEKTGLSYKAALGRRYQRREQMEDPRYVPPPVRAREQRIRTRVTFAEFGKVFMRDWASTRRSETTWFKPMVHLLNETFGKKYLDAITQHMITRYIATRRKKCKAATVNHDLRFLKCLFNRAVEWGYLDENPARRIKPLREPATPTRFLSREETERLKAAADEHLLPLLRAALLTGMRRGELLGLTWDRVDLERRMIRLEHTKSGDPRDVPINDDLAELLDELPRYDHGRVFTYRGRPIDSVKKSWEKTRRRAKLPDVRFHDLRHTWASRLVAAGVDLYELMAIGGWRSISMVQRYARFAPERKIETARLLNGTA